MSGKRNSEARKWRREVGKGMERRAWLEFSGKYNTIREGTQDHCVAIA